MSDFQSQEKQKKQEKQEQKTRSSIPGGCPVCGHQNPAEAKFCEECGTPLGGTPCPNCGETVPQGGDICEACGQWLNTDACAFCGAELQGGAAFCGECGNPAGGINCPSCGTVSFFDYCPKCHNKLTEQADEMLAVLEKEPALREYLQAKQEFSENIQEMKKLEAELAEAEKSAEPEKPELDQSGASVIAGLGKKRKAKRKPKLNAPPAGAPETVEAQQQNAKAEEAKKEKAARLAARKKRLEELKAKQAGLTQKLNDPPPVPESLTTNQEVRRYQMSIKPPVTKGWLCNAFDAVHQDPMHCTRPGDGGRWLTE
ncbi:MAG: zinc ribbon domain-containing protein [Spirochaetia bacterium]